MIEDIVLRHHAPGTLEDAEMMEIGSLPTAQETVMVDAGTRPGPAGRHGFVAGLLAALREHALLLAIVVIHLLVTASMPAILGRSLHFALPIGPVFVQISTIGFWCFLLATIIGFVIAAIRRRDGGPLNSAWRWLRGFFRADRIWGGLIVMGMLPIFGWNFAYLKALIPLMHPFDWDPQLAAFDRWLHFGRAPWEWLQPILGHPLISAALSLVYALWFILLYCVNAWQAFQRRDPVLRMQYLLSTVLIWAVIGNVFCTIFASGGPVYYGRLTGLDDPFAPLMQYLHAGHAVWRNFSVEIQEKVWQLYLVNGQGGEINGSIAAMPSLHVATACSFYLVARAWDRRLGRAFLIFLTLMLIGSVHLGWHYAIDGYAGIAGATIIWYCAGRIVRWPPMQRLLWGGAPSADGGLQRAEAR
jgi:hypothetical protein